VGADSTQAVAFPKPRETRQFDGRHYILEEAIKGDVAFIRASKVDEVGNAVFRYTAQNFSSAMARSARFTIVEVSSQLCMIRDDSDHAGRANRTTWLFGSRRDSSAGYIRGSYRPVDFGKGD